MQIVNAILSESIWRGQSHEQLIDSLGNPESFDKEVLKTKTKETWKYYKIRKNQFALKVFLENNLVIGWDGKGYKVK